ncbi:MAG: 6-pyruvoyl trahydropterin synthase family protein [Candidatus Saccharibacteria bacterium]
MYQVGISQQMIARHSLPQATPGEQDEHAHHYVVEVKVKGERIDSLGYLVDIGELKSMVTEVLDRYRGTYLNDLEEFKATPPSLEGLSLAIFKRLAGSIPAGPSHLSVKVWEDEIAWAGYEEELRG